MSESELEQNGQAQKDDGTKRAVGPDNLRGGDGMTAAPSATAGAAPGVGATPATGAGAAPGAPPTGAGITPSTGAGAAPTAQSAPGAPSVATPPTTATAAPPTAAASATADKSGLKKPITRRTALAIGGGALAGLVVGGFLASWGVTSASIASGQIAILATPQRMIVTNRARCTGCQRCELMCTLYNDHHVSQTTSRVKVWRNYNFGKSISGPDGNYKNMQWVVESCKQCRDPWCVRYCPAHAIVSSKQTGARIIDVKACIACGMCHASCPWNMPTVDPVLGASTKCISCGRCAEQCPNAAILFVDWEDIADKVLEAGAVSTAGFVAHLEGEPDEQG